MGCCGFSQQNFQTALAQFVKQPEFKNASVGINVVDLTTGEPVFSFNSEKLLIPASTMKLVTTAAALELLGSGYRFKTRVAYSGEIENNETLNGNLIVLGGGDPALGSEYFKEHYFNTNFLDVWAQQIKAAGISKIDGDLILDGSVYDSEIIPDTWIWGDIGNYYGAGANAFTVYDNLFRIVFRSPKRAGAKTNIVSVYPKIEGMNLTNEVLSSDINSDQAYVFGSPFNKRRVVRGTIPKNRKAFTIKAAVHHPEEVLARDLILHLSKAGIFISGEVKFENADSKRVQTIYIQESPTLAEIVKTVNHESINLFAEHLVRQIAAEKTGIGNREAGIEIIKEFWQSKGIQSDGFFMEDGSGLSHFNAISPEHFTAILSYMYNRAENKSDFYSSLPSAGKGTVSGFSTTLFPDNSLKAKSGSMTRVRCYAGYMDLDSGKKVAFSIMINHFSGNHSTLKKEIENLLFEIKKTI